MKYIKMKIFFLIFLLIIFLYYLTTKDNNFENFSNKENKVHLFWTGGYDSTFRLCQALIDENKIVQPYYLRSKVDNCKNCKFQRNNREKELQAMKNVINKIKLKFPGKANNLLPVIFVYNINDNKNITDSFFKLRLHNFNRKFNQYEAMSRYAKQINENMEVGTVGITGTGDGKLPTDRWGTYLRANIVNDNGHYRDVDKNSPISNLRFPLAYLSKNDMKDMAITNGYFDIISQSWSCWFPKNGLPCNRCPMCRERVISHPI